MKKLLSLIMTLSFVLLLSACDFNSGNANGDRAPQNGSSLQGAVSEEFAPQNSTDSKTNASQNTISREKAIEISLNHAGFKEAEVINLTAEYDRDITGDEWEVEFDKDNYEYSYEINAVSGEIIKSEKEVD